MQSKQQDQLLYAIRKSDIQLIKSLIDDGINLNFRIQDSGLTPVLVAAGIGNSECIKLLVENGADIFSVDSNAGSSVLHKACQSGNLECVKILMESGAFIDWVSATTGHTPLLEALWFAHPDIVKYLLDKGAGLYIPTHYGFSTDQHLDFEINVNKEQNESLMLCKNLIESRKKSDEESLSKLQMIEAVITNDIAKAENLISNNYNIEERYPFCNSFNDYHTPLLLACRDGMYEIAQLLIEAGADLNAVEPTFGAVPLHKSIYNNHFEITKMLIKSEGINLNFRGYTNGYTPLHDALWHSNAECAQLLIDAGANPNLYGHDSKLPYDIALRNLGENHTITVQLKELTTIN
jgi:ankyrin repeat protein